jgi:hypothetical protein
MGVVEPGLRAQPALRIARGLLHGSASGGGDISSRPRLR